MVNQNKTIQPDGNNEELDDYATAADQFNEISRWLRTIKNKETWKKLFIGFCNFCFSISFFISCSSISSFNLGKDTDLIKVAQAILVTNTDDKYESSLYFHN